MDPAPVATPGERDDLVILLFRAARALVEDLRSRRATSATSGLTPIHGLAAHYLAGRDDVTTSDLARHLRITKQSAAEVVAALEAAGVVQRAPHPCDRRARVVQLTPDGRARLAEGRQRWTDVENELVALVGRERVEITRDVLEAYLAAAVVPSQ